jgi:Ca-activated chloride channel family protein
MTAIVRYMFGMTMVLALTTAAMAADKAIIILDASGSMWGQIDSKPKLEIARKSLHTVLQSMPADLELGFMAYGHREKGNCADIELIVPPAAGTANAITTAADNLKFLGKTPLTAAVKQAAEALKYTEDKATVILITDGLETCNADPCALGRELEAAGVDFTAHVVGFGLTADEGKQVACLAENTGGKYVQADGAAGLEAALVETVVAPAPAPAPEPAPAPKPEKPEFNLLPSVVLAEGGNPITDGNAWVIFKANADGTRGDNLTTEYGEWKGNLEPGDYVIVAEDGEAKAEQLVKIEAGQVYNPVFVLNAGLLIIHPKPSEGADVTDGAAVVIDYPGTEVPPTYYGNTKVVLPAGDQKVTVTIGEGSIVETIPLAAGQTVEKDIVVGVGHVVANAYYVAGGDKVDAGGLTFHVVKAKKKIDGSREDVLTNYGAGAKFDLPPDDYVAITSLDQATVEEPFSIKAGEYKELKVSLNAGVLAISSPGASAIRILEQKKDIQGNRKELAVGYEQNFQTTMPAGDYAIVAERPDTGGAKEGTATVKAGERTEVTVQ